MRRTLVLILALMAPSVVNAQATFDECGTFVADSSGFYDCLLLVGDTLPGPYQLTVAVGGVYVAGDTVHVTGSINTLFPTFCWDPVGQIDVTLIEPCIANPPIAECGMLVEGPMGCTLFMTDTLDTYELENLDGFAPGTQVFVDGLIDATCATACGSTSGCIFGNTIEACPADFVRGDTNNDGGTDIADIIFLLASLFESGAPAPACKDAADMNDDGGLDISDAISGLSALFSGGSIPAPIGACGADPTADTLDCQAGNCP